MVRKSTLTDKGDRRKASRSRRLEKLKDYNFKLKIVREYASGFDASSGYDARSIDRWTPSQKGQLTRYFNQIAEQLSRPHIIYRPRDKEKLRVAQRDTGRVMKRLDVAFVPVSTELADDGRRRAAKTKIDVTFKRRPYIDSLGRKRYRRVGSLKIKSKGISRQVITWESLGMSPIDVAANPEAAIEQLLALTEYESYAILAGGFEAGRKPGSGLPVHIPREHIMRDTVNLLRRYSEEMGFNPENPSSSHWRNWWQGFVGYDFETGEDEDRDLENYRRMRSAKEEINAALKTHVGRLRRVQKRIRNARNGWGIFRTMAPRKAARQLKLAEAKEKEIKKTVLDLLVARTRISQR